jgi:hypothetical protein
MASHPSIERNAGELRRLYDRLNEAFRIAPHGPDHHAACREFHDRYDELAFPGGLQSGLRELLSNEKRAVETWIQFLEVDPVFHRSGYIKEKVIQRLKHVTLTREQRARLSELIIRSMDGGGRREFHGYARLAGALQLTAVRAAAESRLAYGASPEVARRAAKVLHVMHSRAE